jgi:hypothetical protein
MQTDIRTHGTRLFNVTTDPVSPFWGYCYAVVGNDIHIAAKSDFRTIATFESWDDAQVYLNQVEEQEERERESSRQLMGVVP